MEYTLKAKSKKHPLKLALSVIILISAFAVLVFCYKTGQTEKMLLAFPMAGLGVYGFFVQFNTITKSLSFNNVSFSFDGMNYTYQQIEKILVHGGRYGAVYYSIYVGEQRIFTFEGTYEGAKEFMFYLDFYKIPFEHYRMGVK